MRNMIFSGGVAHDYAATSAMLASILCEAGITSEIHEDLEAVEDGRLLSFDTLTLNCARWTCEQTPEWRDEWHFELSGAAREGLVDFLRRSKGLLALHCATICFDDWPEYRKILGASWEWDHSGHGPYQEHKMHMRNKTHPITAGMADFLLMDELYTDPEIFDTVDPLMVAEWEGKTQPMLWVREYETSRVCYCAPGHGIETFENPSYQELLRRCALWVARRL